jgi:hypothetical protein
MSTCTAEVTWQKGEALNVVLNAICSDQFTAAEIFSYIIIIIIIAAAVITFYFNNL